MLFDYNRILRYKTATLLDISYDNQDESLTPALDLTDSEYLLIGMQYPFNNLFAHSAIANTNDSVMSIEYWNGSAWKATVDVLDGTSVGGKTLAKSGHILFSLDRRESGWHRVENTRLAGPPELASKDIYDLYWLKIKVSGDLSALTTINELGFAWTTSAKLKSIKPEVDRYLPGFKTGKTNWIPEIMSACKMMITDFKKAGLVYGPQQVVRMDDFWLPATYKSLWLIYSSLGPAYLETANAMAHEFYKNMNVNNITIDEDLDGKPDSEELNNRVKVGVR